MSFLQKIIPYQGLISINEYTLTAVFCIVVLFFFLGNWWALGRVRSKIKLLLSSESEFRKYMKHNVQISELWSQYEGSFISFNQKKKTFMNAEIFFNNNILTNRLINIRYHNSVSSVLVGIGILGTFAGLTSGVSNFDTSSVNTIKESIASLLAGMSTAFVSSLYGMLFSIIFTIIEKLSFNSINEKIANFCHELNKKYKISPQDERIYKKAEQKEILISIFSHKNDNGTVSPGNILRDIYTETREQSAAIKSFSTDLASKIEAGFESLINNNQIGVIPELQRLKDEIILLGNKISDPSNDMAQNIVKDLQEALSNMVEEMKNTISSTTKDELERIALILGKAGDSLIQFPQLLSKMTAELESKFQDLQRTVLTINSDTMEKSAETTNQLKQQVEGAGEIFTQIVNQLQEKQNDLYSRHDELAFYINEQLVTFKSSVESMNSLTENLTESVSGFEQVRKTMIDAVKYLSNISQNVMDSTERYGNTQNQISENIRKLILEINEKQNEINQENISFLDDLRNERSETMKSLQMYIEQFQIFDSSVKDIFEKIKEGIIQYQKSIDDGIERNLGQYTERVTQTLQSMESITLSFKEIAEELSDSLDKIRFRK
jgi:uncharacterized protein YaaN involved in tellurite resistance